MNADVDVVRLQAKDSALIDHFIKAGEFKNKGEFITYAVKKAINEVILRELEEKSYGKGMPTAYFDTNVYIIGILQPNSNSRMILREIKKGKLNVLLSDYLLDEVLAQREAEVSAPVLVVLRIARDREDPARLSLHARSDERSEGDVPLVTIAELLNVPGDAVEEPEVLARIEDPQVGLLNEVAMVAVVAE